jgi:hypothetical protein
VSAVCIPSYNFLHYINIFIDLVQALKTKHDTPKYGLIYHAQLVGGASTRLKGKVSRMLAAKASLGCRYSKRRHHSQPMFRARTISVADPGAGAFLTHRSGMGKKNQDPRPG